MRPGPPRAARVAPLLSFAGGAFAGAAFVGACASGPQVGPDAPYAPVTTTFSDSALADREALAGLTGLLGGPLPSPDASDPVGVEEPAFELTRVYAASSPRLGSAATRLRATAWRDRVHTLELTFPEGCDVACAGSLESSLGGWLGELHVVEEGRARLLSRQVDTVGVRLEVFPDRPDLTRLLLSCQPLLDRAAGRPSVLPDVGEKAELDPYPPCRALAP